MKIIKHFLKKRVLRPLLIRLRYWLDELGEEMAILPEVQCDNTYPYLHKIFCELMSDKLCARKPMYAWGVIQGATLGKVLGIPCISVIEFGVAGGAGLISLEHTAQLVQSKVNIGIDVYGFDSGEGLPKPNDYRDQPNMWFEGQLPMNRSVLEQQLQSASLRLGLVRETVSQFLVEHPASIAFVSFDLDLYSSTKEALDVFTAESKCLLPRIVCYFDDIMGHSYSDFTGERLAISEFNELSTLHKLSPLYGLRYFVPKSYQQRMYWDCFYLAHFFDHPLYNKLDSIIKAVYVDAKGNPIRLPINSDWRRDLAL